MACREAKWDSMAFVFLNHYLDLSEAIEEGDATMIDNSDFVGTDIPAPFDYALPKKQYLEEQAREDVRDWVLQVSMNQEVDQTLETRTCRNCKRQVYRASDICTNLKFKSPNCLGTGYPIPSKTTWSLAKVATVDSLSLFGMCAFSRQVLAHGVTRRGGQSINLKNLSCENILKMKKNIV